MLNLTLNLLNTELGLTRLQLQERVGGYAAANESSARRAFERDLGALREAGLVVEVLDGQPPRYRIDAASFPAPDVSFSHAEAELLSRAATSWEGQKTAELAVLETKLNFYARTGVDLAGTAAQEAPNFEGLDRLPKMLLAMERRQPISFAYASRKGVEDRDVAPWALVLRGRALYLSAFDLNRWAHRHFRLSRIVGPVTFAGEPGGYHMPPDPQDPHEPDPFRAGPLLWVRAGRAPRVRLRCGAPLPPGEYPRGLTPLEGWDLLRGETDDQAVWERLLLDDCLHAAPAENSPLRARLERLLDAAASLDGAARGE